MKTLPSLFKNDNIRFKDNNKTNCIIKESVNNNVLDTIKEIFNSRVYPFDKNLIIKTKEKIIKTYLVSLLNNKVKTLNDEIINIEDIITIERI